MSIARICLLSVLAAVASCATPKIRHAEIEHAIEDTLPLTDAKIEELSGVTYHATRSLLRIDEALDEEKKPTGTFTAVSLPIAADDRIYVETDTNLLKPIFPLVRDSMDDLGKTGIRQGIEVEFACRAVSINPPQNLGMTVDKPRCGKITYDPIPKDAVLRDRYLAAVKDKWTDTFPVPACRTAKVELYGWGAVSNVHIGGRTLMWPAVREMTLTSVVTDPHYVRVARLPPTGSIAFHTSCGADVLAGEIATDPIWAAIAELGAQAKAFKDAQDADAEVENK